MFSCDIARAVSRSVSGRREPLAPTDRRLWHTYRTDLDGFNVEAEEIRDVGGDRVLFLGRIRWRGVASGIETESPFAMVITVRDGKMFHSVDHLSREEALETLRLSEQDAHADS